MSAKHNGPPCLAVVVLTFNEERHIERCIRSLRGAGKVFVVDLFSADRTIELARAAGASVVQHKFVTQSQQFRWALDNLPIETEWVMRLDADEVLTPELVEEITGRLPLLPPDVTGVNLNRRHIFLGRWIKHGGRYPLVLLRMWRTGAAKIERRWMDEHMLLLHGRAITFEHDFVDHNLNDLTFFTDKHNKYATREAIEILRNRYGLGDGSETQSDLGASRQAAAKRWIKERVYDRLPFWLGPLGYFLFRYFFQLGVLDGSEGLVYHFLQGFWYRFLAAAKLLEYERSLKDQPDRRSRMEALARIVAVASRTWKK